MPPAQNQKEIESLLSEADELIHHLNSGLLDHMEEHHRAKVKTYADEIENHRNRVLSKKEKAESSDFSSSSEGMHKAIDDIVKALKGIVQDLT